MTCNIYAGTDYVYDREETIKKVISNRPDWNSARKEMLKTACYGDIQEGDLFYFKNGVLAEFICFVYDYDSQSQPILGIKYHEEFNGIRKGTIYQYLAGSFNSVFYKVPYFWIDNVPIYEGSVVYGKHNNQKYTVKDGWLIPDSEEYCKILYSHINDYSAFTKQAPKKECWIAFCGELALDKVDTLENMKKFVKQLGYDPESKIMRYFKVDI